jgi:hypothetical protein
VLDIQQCQDAKMKINLPRVVVLAFSMSAACSKTSDECQQFVDKSVPRMEEMAKASGNPLSPDAVTKMLAACRAPDSPMKNTPIFKCVLKTSDPEALRACYDLGFVDK